jgi:ABC-type uncharacterized transport system permease subunit
MSNISIFCFFASYLVAFALELSRLLKRTTISRTVMLLFGTAGLVAHTFYLFEQSAKQNLPPLLSSTHDWMLVLAWVVILFYLFMTTFDRDLAVGLFLLPLVLLFVGAAYFVNDSPNAMIATRESAIQKWAMLHATLLMFGIAGVVWGIVCSLMYLVQHRRLKQQQTLQQGLTLPSLPRLARWNRWSVMVSIPLLTLGMLTGVGLGLYAKGGAATMSFTDPVIMVNGSVWLVMVGFFIWLWRTDRPAGKQVAWLTMWAFGFLLVTLIGLQVLTGGHAAMSVSQPDGSQLVIGVPTIEEC